MKKVLSQAGLHLCVFFTFTMIVWAAMGYLFSGPSYGLNLTASILGFSIALAALQAFWFTEVALKKLSYPARIAGFGLCGLPALSACAWIGQWFPTDLPSAWALFVLIYLVLLAIMTALYTIHFKKTVGSFEQALATYRSKQDK